jgi:hypothetical protein
MGVGSEMAEMVMGELDHHFPHSDILSTFGILYSQYWLQDGVEEAFPRHLQVLKNQFCGTRVQHARSLRDLQEETILELLSASALDIQQLLFKIMMKN